MVLTETYNVNDFQNIISIPRLLISHNNIDMNGMLICNLYLNV